MQNVIIIVFLLILILYGIKESIRHFKGEGGCCGGSSTKPPRKKLHGKVVEEYLFHIEGMHCQNCANTVTREINYIDGASAKVNLKKKQVRVLCDRRLDLKKIIDAVEKRGYTISLIQKDVKSN